MLCTLFDHEPLPTRQGLAVKVLVRRAAAATPRGHAARVAAIELVPVMIEQRSTPRLATAEEARAILAQAEAESAFLPVE